MAGSNTTGGAFNPGSIFTTTHWSVVLAARQKSSDEAAVAMERLCGTYWRPLYAFVRRRGYEIHDAQDLTQEFFARLLQKDFLEAVDRSKGKFRSFLLAALEHFLAKEWRRAHAQKRGGQFEITSARTDIVENVAMAQELTEVSEALDALAEADPALAELVDLKFFCGFTFAEIAAMKNLSERTVQRQWEKARIYLHRKLSRNFER